MRWVERNVGAVIDKLDVRILGTVRLRTPFADILNARRRGAWVEGFVPSAHYQCVGNLRRWGIDAILHLSCKHHPSRPHKIELLNTGNKHFSGLLEEIGRIVEADPESLEPNRMDLAVDIDNISIAWLRHHARIRFKQFSQQIGKMTVEFSEAGKSHIETLYYGRRPNCIRCYDKVAECRAHYLKEYGHLIRPFIRRGQTISDILQWDGWEITWHASQVFATVSEVPSFKDLYGIAPDGVRTRVERQMGGGRIPPDLDRLWKFREHLPKFNPFEQLRLLQTPLSPDLCSLTARDYLIVRGLRSLVLEEGHQRARQQLNARSKRNGSRYFDQYGEFLDIDPADGQGISEGKLHELYVESVRRQMG